VTRRELLEKLKQPEYIGDGVYVYHDGYQMWLYTERDGYRHEIALEIEVMTSLGEYAARIGNMIRDFIDTERKSGV